MVLLCAVPLHAQGVFERLTPEEGLSQSSAHVLFQDRHGFLWIGTTFGLNRYDGQEVQRFFHRPGDSASLPGNYITDLAEDAAGGLWVAAATGAARIHLDPDGRWRFDPVRWHDDPAGDSSRVVIGLFPLGEAGMLVFSDRGTGRVAPGDSLIRSPVSGPPGLLACGWRDRTGQAWLGGTAGLFRLDDVREDGLTVWPVPPPGGDPLPTVLAIHGAGDGRSLWVGTARGLFRSDPERAAWERTALPDEAGRPDRVNALALAAEGRLWIATARGLVRLDPDGGARRFRHRADHPRGLRADYVWDLLVDRTGTLWAGTSPGSVHAWRGDRRAFVHIEEEPGRANTLSSNLVFSLLPDPDGALWIGTWAGGLNRLDPSERFSVYTPRGHGLPGASVYALMRSRQREPGTLWVGTSGGVAVRMGERFRTVPTDRPAAVYALVEDGRGAIWSGTTEGLQRLDPGGDTLRTVWRPGERLRRSVQGLLLDDEATLWIATRRGLFAMNGAPATRGDSIVPEPITELAGLSVMALAAHADRPGEVWAGTHGQGLFRWSRRGATQRYGVPEGLPDSVIQALGFDRDGKLWITTLNGVSRFDPALARFRNFGLADGLQGREFSPGAIAVGDDGELFFGGVNGVNRLDPSRLPPQGSAAPLAIAAVAVDGNARGVPPDGGRVVLRAGEDRLAVRLAVMDFTRPADNRYAYRLNGYDREWVAAGHRSEAVYTGLPPGRYRLEARGAGSNQVWSEPAPLLEVVVNAPFWRTPWFAMLVAALLIAGGYGAHRFRLRMHLDRRRAVEGVRREAARDFHDQLGHQLTKITLFSGMLRDSGDLDGDRRRGYLDTIHQAAERLYFETRDFIWTLDPDTNNLYDLSLYLKDTGQELFDGSGVAFRVEGVGADRFRAVPLDMTVQRHLILIIKEAMHNVLKHAGAANIRLGVALEAGLLRLTVRDDGRGMPESPSGLGQGLANMRRRAARIGGTVRWENGPDGGAEVILEWPVPGAAPSKRTERP